MERIQMQITNKIQYKSIHKQNKSLIMISELVIKHTNELKKAKG
jgi:hypothetical protein